MQAHKELDTRGRQTGGLHAVSGTLPSGSGQSVRLTVLGMILRSQNLPESFAQAKFCLWLKANGKLEAVKKAVESAGKDWSKELNNLYVSPIIAEALLITLAGGLAGLGGGKVLLDGFQGMDTFLPGFMVKGSTMALGLAIAAGLGILAGLVPAWQAMRLPVVTALRRLA